MDTPGLRGRMRRTSHSRPVRWLARAGLFASGLVHALIGSLGIAVVVAGFTGSADQSGALQVISSIPGGVILLWACAICLVGLGLWQWTGALSGTGEFTTVIPTWLRNQAKAVAYTAMGLACGLFAVGARLNGAESARTFTNTLIGMPGGVFVLAGVGGVIGTVGIAYIIRGARRYFLEDIDPPPTRIGTAVIVVGVIGHVMKGLALLLVGVLFVSGAIATDSTWASGLDGAIRWLAGQPTGPWPLLAVASGFIVHGFYLAARGVFIRR